MLKQMFLVIYCQMGWPSNLLSFSEMLKLQKSTTQFMTRKFPQYWFFWVVTYFWRILRDTIYIVPLNLVYHQILNFQHAQQITLSSPPHWFCDQELYYIPWEKLRGFGPDSLNWCSTNEVPPKMAYQPEDRVMNSILQAWCHMRQQLVTRTLDILIKWTR